MGKKPKLDELAGIIENKDELFLTDREYSEITGADLPRKDSFLVRYSSFSAWLSQKGYVIADIRTGPAAERTMHIKRRS